jgi:hypothetical protein
VPVAVTVNLAVCPTLTVLLAGCVVILGGTLTVKVALWLVTLPPPLLTTTEKRVPLSAATVGGVVYQKSLTFTTSLNTRRNVHCFLDLKLVGWVDREKADSTSAHGRV